MGNIPQAQIMMMVCLLQVIQTQEKKRQQVYKMLNVIDSKSKKHRDTVCQVKKKLYLKIQLKSVEIDKVDCWSYLFDISIKLFY